MTGHEGAVARVRNDHGYDIGFTARCACGWTSGELRDRPGQAMPDLLDHLAAAAHVLDNRPTETP